MQCFGLPPKGIKTRFVEICRGEAWVPFFGKAPWALVKALTRDVDIVGVENAVDEARDHVGTCQVSDAFDR